MSGPIRAGVYGPREDVDKTSVDYPAVKVRYASYEQIEKRALIHQQDSGDITKDFLVRKNFVWFLISLVRKISPTDWLTFMNP